LREAPGALIDLEHGNVASAGIDYEQKAAEPVDGHRATLQAVGKRRAGHDGKSAGLAVFREGGKLRRSGGEGNRAEDILLLRSLGGRNGGQGCVQKQEP